MTPDIPTIAAGLSEAQRRALILRDNYADPNTTRALRRKGLVLAASLKLTPLGEQVRAYLQEQAK